MHLPAQRPQRPEIAVLPVWDPGQPVLAPYPSGLARAEQAVRVVNASLLDGQKQPRLHCAEPGQPRHQGRNDPGAQHLEVIPG